MMDQPHGSNRHSRALQILAGTDFRAYLTVYAILVVASLTLYWPILRSGLLSDDWGLSVPDRNVWKSFFGFWFGGGKGAFYRPLSRLLIYYEARVFGYSGLAQHLVSLALFFGAVYITGRLVLLWRGVWAALLCITLLLFNPILTDSVAWISSQTDLLVTFFTALLITFAAKDPAELTRRRVSLSLICSFLAYLSKDSAAILGPLSVAYLALLVLIFGPRLYKAAPNGLLLGAANLILFLLYLGFRKWRLGQVGGLSVPGFVPREGVIWHVCQYYTSVLREYLIPWIREYPVVPSTDVSAAAALWPAILTAALIAWVIMRRNFAAAFCGLGWLAALAPFVTSMVPYYYPESGLTDSHRYLYMPSFFLAAFAGFLVSPKQNQAMSTGEFAFAALLILAFLNGTMAQKTITDYKAAGEARTKINDTIRTVSANSSPAFNVYVRRLPDSIGRAFLFRNGFYEFMRVNYPQATVIEASSFRPEIAAGETSFLFDAPDSHTYTIRKFEEPAKIAKLRTGFTGQVPPYMIDVSRKIMSIEGIGNSSSIEVVKNSPDGIELRIVGPDPFLTFAPIKTQPYYMYSKAVLKLELLGTRPEQKEESDTAQFMWALKSDTDTRSFPVIEKRVKFIPGVQSLEFDLQNTLSWYMDGELKLMRFNLPSRYRGLVRIHAMGLE